MAVSQHFTHSLYHQIRVKETQSDACKQACESKDQKFL